MATINFSDVLNKKIEDVERPPVVPIGDYRAKVSKVPEINQVTSSKTGDEFDVVEFQVKLVEAVEVDPDDLEAFGGDVAGVPPIRHSFMFNKGDAAAFARSEFNLRRFLEEHLKVAAPTDTLKEALANSNQAEFLVTVGHRPDPNDPENKYVDIKRTAPLD